MVGSLVRSTRKPPPPAPVKVCPIIMKTFTEVMTSDQSPSPGITSLSYKEYLVGICSKPYPTFVAKIYHLSPLFSFGSKVILKWRFQLAALVSHLINALTFSLKESFPRFVCLTVDISSVSYLVSLFSTISHGSLLFFRDLYFVPRRQGWWEAYSCL